MPRYDFNCKTCNVISTITLSIDQFKGLKNTENVIFCKNCGESEKMSRIFSPSFGKIWKGKEEILSSIKEDVNKIVKKVKSGDQSAIREIYGDEK